MRRFVIARTEFFLGTNLTSGRRSRNLFSFVLLWAVEALMEVLTEGKWDMMAMFCSAREGAVC